MPDPMQRLLDGFAEDRLSLPFCESCGAAHLYPRARCPHCGGAAFAWRDASGAGTLASFSVVHRAPSPDFAAEVPYTVAVVRLAEGPQLMSRLVDAAPEATQVGQPVRLRFATMPGGQRLPVFTPESQ
ncbi:MAG TPA: Zn-ribbon domain-containing OB-fold protein [Falsiroseomonas sp.]|jgi:uncharacterized OB-fold protein|nr:Zn-ribbon domain-containing OB-fold protein [Falsiroseomonas sp.]